eukprot:scaffold49_cov409-Prasinococcus_capsulatus_cf.AAC.15
MRIKVHEMPAAAKAWDVREVIPAQPDRIPGPHAYVELNPIPKRPVFSGLFRFEVDEPTLLIDSKSSSEKTASLYTKSAGP